MTGAQKKRTLRGARHLLTRKVSHKRIKKLKYKFKDPRFTERCSIILMAKKNRPLYEIAENMGLSEDDVRAWTKQVH